MEMQTKSPYHDQAVRWAEHHPEAMAEMESMALSLARRGRKVGIQALAERVRWEFKYERGRDEEFKINNNYLAALADLIIERHPHLEECIDRRRRGHRATFATVSRLANKVRELQGAH